MIIRTQEHEWAPETMRWSAVDDDTYDGAEDSTTRAQIGWGATEQEAIDDLCDQLFDADDGMLVLPEGWREPGRHRPRPA